MAGLFNLVVAFRPSPKLCWIADIMRRCPHSFVRVIQVDKNNGSTHANILFEVIAPKDGIEQVKRTLANHELLKDLQITSVKNDKLYGSAKALCAAYCPLARVGYAFLRGVTSSNNGEIYWNFVGSEQECGKITRELSNSRTPYRVVELTTIKENGGMTGRQELVLRVACELGYFDYPKRINVRELAAMFNVTPATITEELRKGVKKALTYYFRMHADNHLT